MIRLVVRLALAALIANAAWRIGTAYLSYFKFTDSVRELAEFGGDQNEDQLRQRVRRLAEQYDIPLADDVFTVRRDGEHTYVSGSYVMPLEVFPGYRYPWPFTWNVDAVVNRVQRIPPLRPR